MSIVAARTTWLPDGWAHPTRVVLETGHHLRPIRATDVDPDLPAVMGSRARLWSIYGPAWGWPPADMTVEQDREDLALHEAEIEAHESFNYALFDADETALLGCVYIDPPEKVGADAEISWWVVDRLVGSDVERALDALLPRWIGEAWPLTRPRYVGRDLTWAEWMALPELPAGTPPTPGPPRTTERRTPPCSSHDCAAPSSRCSAPARSSSPSSSARHHLPRRDRSASPSASRAPAWSSSPRDPSRTRATTPATGRTTRTIA
jgi:hypothetical protein